MMSYLMLGAIFLGSIIACGNAALNCDQNFVASTGTVSSPNYPSTPSESNIVCRYRIRAPVDKRIQITFLSNQNVQSGHQCYYAGGLRIFEGNNPDLDLDVPNAQFCNSRLDNSKKYVSNRNAVVLVYTNKYTGYSFRFRLVYRFITAFDMVYNNDEGLLYSPYFMNRALPRTETYTYRIETGSGKRIYLSFSYINFGSDTTCSKTSLKIYEGSTTGGAPKETRCGGNTADYLSMTNTITIKYATNELSSSLPADHGFIIYYSSGTHGCNKFLTSSSGVIFSPMSPSMYPNNTKCQYNITAERGHLVYVAFRSMYLNNGDAVSVYERDHSTGQLTKRIAFTRDGSFYSWSNSLLLEFKSDQAATYYSFKIEYMTTKGCNLTMASYEYYITSPLYPLSYPNNSNCIYKYTNAKLANYRTTVTFNALDIENSDSCTADGVSVYDGSNSDALLLDKMCGVKSTYQYMASESDFFLKFWSNSRLTRSGFQARFSHFYVACAGSYSYQSTSIDSPNYPHRYPHKESCQNSISNYYGNKIVLQMTHFDVEPSNDCKKDSLKIYEGTVSKETLVSTRCGNDTSEFVSRTHMIYLVFTTDANIAHTGYRIHYKACGGNFVSSNVYQIESPRYPKQYPSDSICRYILQSSIAGFGIRLEFSTFDLEDSASCQNDNVTIYENQISDSNLVATLCGSGRDEFFSNTRLLHFIFKSNGRLNRQGFNIRVEPCHQLFTNESGTLTSPGFPSRYPMHVLCTYAIRLEKGAKVQLVFQNFSLYTSYSEHYLKVYDGRNTSATLITTMTGRTFQNVLSSSNEVFILFKSFWYNQNDLTWHGFKLRYFDNQGFCSKHKPCMNNATCSDLSGDYLCSCTSDYSGKNCSEKIIPCKSSPCLHNGTCSNIYGDGVPKYSCNCLDEYIGKDCEKFIDPCLDYVTEDRWQRSTKSIFNNMSMTPLCDSNFKKIWYRFTSKAGGKIPSKCPAVNSCGTSQSVWANGTLPSIAGTSGALVACVRKEDSCCSDSWLIRVRKCKIDSHEFLLYKLPPTPRCPMSYCAGSEVPCPRGSASKNGFTPCLDKVPKILSDPKVSATVERGQISFTCGYDIEEYNDQARFEVRWYQGNSTKEIAIQNPQWWERHAYLKNKEKEKPLFRLGTTIYCKVRTWMESSKYVKSEFYESNHLFSGIMVTPNATRLRVREGGKPMKIKIQSTVPVVCPGNAECQVHVQIIHDTKEIFLNTCSIILRKGHLSHTIEMHAKRDFIDDGDKKVTLKFAISDATNAPDWHNHEEIKDIQADVIDVGTARCSSNGDPRFYTFDNRYYGHFQPGDHVFVKSTARNFEVHVRTWQCGGVTCNCGIVAREDDDVILFDMCWDGIPRFRFLSKEEPSEGTSIKRDPSGKSFIMKFPSGAYVRIDTFSGFANFIVQVPSDEFGSTRGLCGTFDNNYYNEMLSKENYHYDYYHFHGNIGPWAFTESWKLPMGKSLFYHRAKESGCQKQEKLYCHCTGEPSKKDKVICEAHQTISHQPKFPSAGDDWIEFRYPGESSCSKRKKRSLESVITLPEDDEAIGYVYDPKPLANISVEWPTKSGRTEENVTNYCNEVIRNSAPGKVCAKMADFNFTSYILQCIDDIKITDDLQFSSASIRTMQDSCEEKFLKNTSYWEKDPSKNGSFVPPIEMGNTLCPGLCNGHGKCEKGKCICHLGYIGADCAVDKMKGPTVTSIPGNGTCDVRKRKDCHKTRIIGKDFIDSSTLTCRAVKMIDDKKMAEATSHRAYMLSFLEVLCDLEEHPVGTSGDPLRNRSSAFAIYNLEISNDRKIYSQNKVSYIIFDSKCMQCNTSTASCSIKPDTCNINGHCFINGEKYSSDPCYICKPSISETHFSPNCSSRDEQTEELNLAFIVPIAVASAVFILMAIIVAVFVMKKKTQKRVQPELDQDNRSVTFENKVYTVSHK